MKVNVYTRNDKVQSIELNVNVAEYYVIQKALCIYAGNPDMPVEDRILAVGITDDMNEKEQVELEEFNQKLYVEGAWSPMYVQGRQMMYVHERPAAPLRKTTKKNDYVSVVVLNYFFLGITTFGALTTIAV